MLKFLTLALSATGALAALGSHPALVERQLSCATTEKDCGTGCIEKAWTCCPDGKGACGPTDYCNLGTDKNYNCCPVGSVCTGAAGTPTPGPTTTRTLTSTITSKASTSSARPTTTLYCAATEKDCGTGCIDLGWTCCPDAKGGCGPSDYCNLGDNKEYNCCPRGSVCTGAGGVTTIAPTTKPATTGTVTRTSTTTRPVVIVTAAAAQVVPGIVGMVAGAAALIL